MKIVKQIIECPHCGAIEIVNEVPEFFHSCESCRFLLPGWKLLPAISVRQPWAYLLCAGIKDVENRTWKLPEKYKGKRVLIHAGAKLEFPKYSTEQYYELVKFGNWIPEVSAIIGSVVFTDCEINHPSIWAEKTEVKSLDKIMDEIELRGSSEPLETIYNWVATKPVLFEKPIPCKGQLSFFTPKII